MSRALSIADYLAPGDAYHLARITRRPGTRPEIHTHADFAEFFCVEAGRGLHLVNGSRTELAEGDLVFIRSEDTHGFRVRAGEELTFVNAAFPVETIEHLGGRYEELRGAFFWSRAAVPDQRRLGPPQRAWMAAAFALLAERPYRLLSLERTLLGLFHRLWAAESRAYAPGVPPWLSSALREIRDPRHLPGGVRELVHLAGRSPEHVSRQVREHLGQTPGRLVNQLRMDHAASQLTLTDKKVMTIAQECGFTSVSHFHKLFRERFGRTPKEWRGSRLELIR